MAMRERLSKKRGRQQKGIGGAQLRNVRAEQEIRRLEQQLREMGHSDADIRAMIKEAER